MNAAEDIEHRVAVYFGREMHVVTVDFDPIDPPSDDVLIDRAREIAIAEYQPAASFRKGIILD